jgi:4-hydroxy-2-oxoheptanedioate aldolase
VYRPNRLKARLADGKRVYGAWCVLGSAFTAEVMALCGFDFLILDQEHGLGTLDVLAQQLQAVQTTETTALVRVPGQDADYLKRVLDHGAEGVIVPNVNTGDEARAAAAACRYPPRGTRGSAPTSVRASSYGMVPDYAARAGDQMLVICQIETVAGVENADAIAAADGVDMIFIGPSDLSNSAGHPGKMDHPDVLALIGRAEQAANKAGKPLGTILKPGVTLQQTYEVGYHFVAAGSDLSRLREGCVRDVKQFRDLAPA